VSRKTTSCGVQPRTEIMKAAEYIAAALEELGMEERIDVLNSVRLSLHAASPFKGEPVDCVVWEPFSDVCANDYNPNTVAPPEMRLLEVSILEDGYTQPIVAWKHGKTFEVVDGFHRNRVGRECSSVRSRVHGYLPLSVINAGRTSRDARIASTIRHNRARGKHRVDAMSDIVVELKKRNWSTDRICRELGMDPDEVLRLCQITGLSELFSDQEFSKSWDVEGEVTEADFRALTDDVTTYSEEETADFRTVNTGDPARIFHTYKKWECHKAGFYATSKPGMTKTECEAAFRDFLANTRKSSLVLGRVTQEWKHSCEHYLTNSAMNRIAWLGQAAVCYATGVPSTFCSGFNLLTHAQQIAANKVALRWLNIWLAAHKLPSVTMAHALGDGRQSTIY